MNDPISWHPSLVKKFSSSNHYKLLNQLKIEVKKYPLNNKKKVSSMQSKDINQDNQIKSNISNPEIRSSSNNSYHMNEETINKSTVSFNNATNFSIYDNKNITSKNETPSSDQLKSKKDISAPSFKERLNQIDMK